MVRKKHINARRIVALKQVEKRIANGQRRLTVANAELLAPTEVMMQGFKKTRSAEEARDFLRTLIRENTRSVAHAMRERTVLVARIKGETK